MDDRVLALKLAMENSGGFVDAATIVGEAETFLAFLTGGDTPVKRPYEEPHRS